MLIQPIVYINIIRLFIFLDEISSLVSEITASISQNGNKATKRVNKEEEDVIEEDVKPKNKKRKTSDSKKSTSKNDDEDSENYEVERVLDCRKRKVLNL